MIGQKVAEFKPDEVGRYVINDETLCAWGNGLTIKDGYQQRKYIRDKLRVVATFCKRYHKEYATEDRSVKENFQTKNFPNILNLAQTSWVKSLTPPVKLGLYIKEILIIFKQDAIFTNDADRKIV